MSRVASGRAAGRSRGEARRARARTELITPFSAHPRPAPPRPAPPRPSPRRPAPPFPAPDSLLMRLPNLESLHLGNNQLDSNQAVALAASITRHRVSRLCNLTLGSNDIGDAGLAAILKALPPTMKQLYLHGCDIHDAGLESLRTALEKMPDGEWASERKCKRARAGRAAGGRGEAPNAPSLPFPLADRAHARPR